MKNILLLLTFSTFVFSQDYNYSFQDYNSTSPTYNQNVGPSYFDSQGKPISINFFGWES